MTVDTGKVSGRREVHYGSFADLVADTERLAASQHRSLGNWTLGQVLFHLATAMEMSIDGYTMSVPWPVRVIGSLFMKRRMLKSMPSGFKLPAKAKDLLPPETSDEQGLEMLRRAVQRIETETARSPHPVFGSMTREESNQLALRHAEMHMSFIVPADGE